MTRISAKKIEAFRAWLAANGAEVFTGTNEFELVRFKTGKPGVSVIYRKASGRISSFTGESSTAWDAFTNARGWRATPRVKRNQKGNAAHKTLLNRDGDYCFFCGEPLADDITVEHLVPLTAGGPDNLANKVLAHRRCNEMAWHMSAMKKIALRDWIIKGKINEK